MTLSSLSFASLSLMYVPFEISVAIFCLFYCKLFVFLLLNFENSLYIQDTSPTFDTYFVNIFSQPITCLSIIFHSFLQKADIFYIQVQFVIFVLFMNFCASYQVIFAQSKGTDIFLQRSVFHVELILVHAVRYGSKIFVLFCFDSTYEHSCGMLLLQHHLLNRLFFLQ